MIEGANGVMMGVPMHYTLPPAVANDVSAAKAAQQQQFGNNAPDNGAALAAAIKKIQQENSAITDGAPTVEGDRLASGSDASSGNVPNDASQQIAGLHLFADANNSAALAALNGTFKPATVSVSSPFDASALAQAQAALEKALGNGPVNAQTLQNALVTAKAVTDENGDLTNANIGDTTWAQAALVEQAQADGRANASNDTAAPKDMIAQASGELSGDRLFDASTLNAATQALQGGTLVDGSSQLGSVSWQEKIPSASNPSAAQYMQRESIPRTAAVQYMQNLVNEGMTMPEAIVLTRAWLGGTSGAEPALVRAALTVRAEQPDIMQQYHNDPTQDPIKLAAQRLETLNKTLSGNANDPANLLNPALIDQIAGKPGAPGTVHDDKPNAGRMLERRLIGSQDVKPNMNFTLERMPAMRWTKTQVAR